MGLLLQKLAKTYDIVLIDSAPIIGLSDAPILSRLAEATLVVVSFNQVTRKAARAALKRLRASGANVIGAVFTKFAVGKLDYNYSYKYLNYHYYNYGEATPKIENKIGDGVRERGRKGVNEGAKEGTATEHEKIWSFAAVSHRMRRHIRNLGDRIKSAT
jgi:hypothetical protein